MNSSFYSAITGAKSHQVAIDGTANNIANINTAGYKASITEFSTLFERFLAVNAQTQTSNDGTGVRVGATAIDMRSGIYQQTDSLFDVAIDGDGWFGTIARNAMDAKEVAYTRNGSFGVDEDRMLVNQNGNYILGTSYGNMVFENGNWRVDPSVKAGGLSTVLAQNKLFIPEDLIYPAVATTKAKISGNLQAGEGANTSYANSDSAIYSLYDRNANPMNITKGQNLLISVGGENITADSGELILEKSVAGMTQNEISFTLNGANISVQFEAGDTYEQKASKLAEAINSSGVATAKSSGETITIRSDEMSIRSNQQFFVNTSAKIVVFGDDLDTLGKLKEAISGVVKSVNSQTNIALNSDGALQIDSLEAIKVDFKDAGNTNNALLFALEAMNSVEHNKLVSNSFRESVTKSAQTVITPDGKQLLLENSIRETTPPTLTSGASFEIVSKIREYEGAKLSSDLADIEISSKPLELKNGENFWFAFGKEPTTTNYGTGYSFDLKSLPLGTDPKISFELDGKLIEFESSGVSIESFRSSVAELIRSHGYEVVTDNQKITIYPVGETMQIKNSTTTLQGANLADFSMSQISYPADKTIGSVANKLESIARDFGATVAFENGQFKITNNSVNSVRGFISTSSPFSQILSNLNSVVEPNGRLYSSKLNSFTTISTSEPKQFAFDENGKIAGEKNIEIANNGKKLQIELDLSSFTSYKTAVSTTTDGVREGKFDGYNVGKDGEIIATFDNARTAVVAQMAVYHFVNDQGLMRIGDSQFMESANSGQPQFWVDSDGNTVTGASINSNMLEGSNVQGSIALTDLIIYQRAYEGNAKAITTSDELIKNAINMKR